MAGGRLLQARAAATGNARSLNIERRASGRPNHQLKSQRTEGDGSCHPQKSGGGHWQSLVGQDYRIGTARKMSVDIDATP